LHTRRTTTEVIDDWLLAADWIVCIIIWTDTALPFSFSPHNTPSDTQVYWLLHPPVLSPPFWPKPPQASPMQRKRPAGHFA
jgi:hypothetical protein